MHIVLAHGSRHRRELKKFANGIQKFGHTINVVSIKDTTSLSAADVLVTYGNLRINRGKRPWIHMDSGYLRRNRYYRASLNCNFPSHYLMNDKKPSKRWYKLGLTLEPWKSNLEGPVIVCASSYHNHKFLGLKISTEKESVIAQLRAHMRVDRKIIYRRKSESTNGTPLYELLKTAYCVVTWGSNSAVEAIMAGVPAFVLSNSAAIPVARTSLSYIENPLKPSREQWLYNLAYHQWTLKEFARGLPWKELMNEA